MERFLEKIKVTESGCWEWIAYRNPDGYGTFSIRHWPCMAHRISYEYYYGEIDPNLTIDHLCRNRGCVNPYHLEQVTIKTNIRRGLTGLVNNNRKGKDTHNGRKTHCKRGHEYNEKNTYYSKLGRDCRKCKALRQKQYIKNRFFIIM